MYKLFACWTAPEPEDVEAFEEHYLNIHIPKATAVPHIERLVMTRTAEGLEGAESPFYRVAEMIFPSQQALHESAKSPQWQKTRVDSAEMIERFGVSLTVSMGQEVDAPIGPA